MTTAKSTTSAARTSIAKPKKPCKDFPLFPHATRRWAKKIRGKFCYFGPWDDPDAALQRYLDQKDDLFAGRTPRAAADSLTVADLCNRFLTAKQYQVDASEITQRTFDDYHATCARLVAVLGRARPVDELSAHDFERLRAETAKKWGPVALGNEVQRVRVVFNYAYQAGLIDKPMRYGPTFRRPSKKVLRAERQKNGPKMFEAAEIRRILGAAPLQLRCMILLGANCGFGNHDCGTLPIKALDLDAGWVIFPRPKTAIQRRCPLWPETVEALEEWLKRRPEPKSDADRGLVFVTKYGQRWSNGGRANPISAQFRKLLRAIDQKAEEEARQSRADPPTTLYRKRRAFYALRHTFETIAGDSRDQVAVDHIMGHSRDDMASLYRERISDERLRAVTDHIRRWLFSDKTDEAIEKRVAG